MSTQLRLVETPGPDDPIDGGAKRPARSTRPKPGRGRAGTPARGRRVHWDGEWRLDARTRQVGQQGIAAARAALRAHRPGESESIAS